MGQLASRRRRRAPLHRRLVAIQSRFVRRRSARHGLLIHDFPQQTPAEEWVNTLTHGVAAVASFVGGIWLVLRATRSGSALATIGCAAYALSLTNVFVMSALSHWFRAPRLRSLFRTFDQAAIYFLIVGSATPLLIRYLLPIGWDWLLPLQWGLALLLAWDKLRGHRVNSTSVVSYVSLAWLPTVAARPMLTAMPAACTALIVAMGACYMLGVVFLVFDDRRRYFHALWHLFVIAASACSFAAIALYVVADPSS